MTSTRASAVLFLLVAIGCAESIQFMRKPQPPQESKGTTALSKMTKPQLSKGAQAVRAKALAYLKEHKPAKKASAAAKAKLQKLKAALKKDPKAHTTFGMALKATAAEEKKHPGGGDGGGSGSGSGDPAAMADDMPCPAGMSDADCDNMKENAAQHGGTHHQGGDCPDGMDDCGQMNDSHAMEADHGCDPEEVLQHFGGEIPDEEDAKRMIVAERCPESDPLCECIETEVAEACYPRDCANCLEGDQDACAAYGKEPADVCECVADFDHAEDALWTPDPSLFDPKTGEPLITGDDSGEEIVSTGDAIVESCFAEHPPDDMDMGGHD